MTETDKKREDEVLKRLLKTPPQPRKENGADPKADPADVKRRERQ